MKFYVFLGDGFETVEALGAIDILRNEICMMYGGSIYNGDM